MKTTSTSNKQEARREVPPAGNESNRILLPKPGEHGQIVPVHGSSFNWIRLPKPGEHEPNTGLGRSVLTRLCIEGRVKSISLKDPGKARGCRLVNLPSLLSYLASLEAAQMEEQCKAGGSDPAAAVCTEAAQMKDQRNSKRAA